MNSAIIGIAGGSCSGKSTFIRKISQKYGNKITFLSLDDYYKSTDYLSAAEKESTNYDHPNAFDIELLTRQLYELKNGNEINCPIYDYTIHNRKAETKKICPQKVIIIEGILILHFPKLRDLLDIKVFIDLCSDKRLRHRLIRDINERSRTKQSVITQYNTTVRPMHDMYIEPSKEFADIIIYDALSDISFKKLSAEIDRLLLQN